MKLFNDNIKDILGYLVYPVITLIWLVCLTIARWASINPVNYTIHEQEIKKANITITQPIQIKYDTIYVDMNGVIIEEKTNG